MSSTSARYFVALAALAVAAPASLAQHSALVEFDAGAQGWSINGLNAITPTGGNPAERILWNNPISTSGLEVRNNTQAAFLGDYGAKGDVSLGLDVQVDFIQFFGSPVPRELVVILYDDDVQGPSGPAGVWTSLGVLDGNGMPWTTFSTDVVAGVGSQFAPGWKGRGDEDPTTFEPILPAGSTYNSVLSGIDRIQFTTYVPGFFYGGTNFRLSVDNISIQPLAWQDVGSALPGVAGDPVLVGTGDLSAGSANSLGLSNAAPNATIGYIVGVSAANLPFSGGTLVPNPQLVFLLTSNGAGALDLPFIMPPGTPSGSSFIVQVAVQDGAAVAGIALSNALVGTTP